MSFSAESKRQFAKQLQAYPTNSERILCDALDRKGYRFQFNEVLLGYIPDFYFPHLRKIVELDGRKFHDAEKDKKRDAFFVGHGIETFRVRSSRVFTDLGQVLRSIDIFLGTPVSAKARKQKKSKKQKTSPKWKKKLPKVLKGFKRVG